MSAKLTLLLAAATAVACVTASPSAFAERKPRNAASTVQRTGPQGQSLSRHSEVSTDGQGNGKLNTTVTGPKGKTATSDTTVTKTDDGYARQTVRTGPNGQSTSVDGGVSVDPATGTVTQSRTRTGADGQVKGSTSRVVTPGATAP